MDSLEGFARVGKAMGDLTRLRILAALGVRELCVCELTSLLGQRQSVVSRHLGILRDAGLVQDVRSGKWVNYRLRPHARGGFVDGVLAAYARCRQDSEDLRELCRRAQKVDRRSL